MKHSLLYISLLLLTACHSARHVVAPDANVEVAAQTGKYATANDVRRTNAVAAATQYITARVNAELTLGEKSISTGGTLRMKRDEVVQLTLTFLGAEVGRMEFGRDSVLVIDRLNKQYLRAAYDEVYFLRSAGLDFRAVQSLFWNELFTPSQTTATPAPERFRLSTSGEYTLLSVADAPLLEYDFLARTRTMRLERVDVAPKAADATEKLTWTYGTPQKFGGTTFPTVHELKVSGVGQHLGLRLVLSRLGTGSDWTPRSTVKASYRRLTASQLERMLQSLTF